ncbi:MAG TPA: HAD hydrolase-like protein [Phycisphaerae bacterium]|nr:HAD family hydrolase [Phycisphaerales bacterium]HRX86439.1 HAD hydrolase-like protein [Phycisphaerae bacterium]
MTTTPDDPARPLHDFAAQHEFLIGLDSDGCVFDTMEVKHKECFIPCTIRHFGLQAVSKYAREAAEFVNLYSTWRGSNRFPALLRTLELLGRRGDVLARSFVVPELAALRAWLAAEPKPGNPALTAAAERAAGAARAELEQVLAWSHDVNNAIGALVMNVPPFPLVRECLTAASRQADLLVVSATPHEALAREWQEHDIARHVAVIAGQEMGAKKDHLRIAMANRYRPENVLMVGDAPGDLQAARANGARFYPIVPGAEAESWQRFLEEALERFFAGRYAGAYENARIAEFEALLPEAPPWQRQA